VGDGLAVERRGEIPVRAAEVDVVLDGPPAPQLGHLQEVLARARRGLVIVVGCCHRGLLVPRTRMGSVGSRRPCTLLFEASTRTASLRASAWSGRAVRADILHEID
jgi:hypothetical protein